MRIADKATMQKNNVIFFMQNFPLMLILGVNVTIFFPVMPCKTEECAGGQRAPFSAALSSGTRRSDTVHGEEKGRSKATSLSALKKIIHCI